MSLIEFWNDIHDSGNVIVDADPPRPTSELESAIAATEQQWRLELAYAPPPSVKPAAVWATLLMYRACQCLVYREIDAKIVARDLAEPCPVAPSPATCYSVDVAMRLLPELLTHARGVSDDDPLVTGLMKLAKDWPLSSVGVRDVGEVTVDSFIDDACLRRLYVDRVLARGDMSRLDDSRVAAAAREAIGLHTQLAPQVAKALETAKESKESA